MICPIQVPRSLPSSHARPEDHMAGTARDHRGSLDHSCKAASANGNTTRTVQSIDAGTRRVLKGFFRENHGLNFYENGPKPHNKTRSPILAVAMGHTWCLTFWVGQVAARHACKPFHSVRGGRAWNTLVLSFTEETATLPDDPPCITVKPSLSLG